MITSAIHAKGEMVKLDDQIGKSHRAPPLVRPGKEVNQVSRLGCPSKSGHLLRIREENCAKLSNRLFYKKADRVHETKIAPAHDSRSND